jgi:SPP1 family predicted phage head-tail adaptor
VRGTHIGELDRRITIERKVVGRDADFGSEVISWSTLAEVWAKVEDVPEMSRGGAEAVRADQRVATTRTNVRVRYRSDVTSDMRVRLADRGRTLQIVGITEAGSREWTDLLCEEFS